VKHPLNEAEAFRAQELLLDRAVCGLDPAEAAELAALGVDGDESFDLAAAALDVATVRLEAMPAAVADRILAAAGARPAVPQTLAGVVPARAIDTSTRSPEPPAVMALPPAVPIRRSRAPMIAAWMAAAACLALAVGAVLWARGRERAPSEAAAPTPAEARAELLATAGDAAALAWQATGDAAGQGASGDVVWSPSRQRGYMRFRGLAPNDPRVSQYQLWIFDQQRDDRYPVDGGVFDVTSSGEVIVPISAKLPVGGAVLFAVTVEAPGGVVVSRRERIVVTAAPGQAG
jgi:anti-sigma-K factor RskA